MSEQDMSENFSISTRYCLITTQVFLVLLTKVGLIELRSPDEFHVPTCLSQSHVLLVDASEKHGFHTHFRKKKSVCG